MPKYLDDDIIIFFVEPAQPYQDFPCPQINISDLYGYYGTAIATSLNTARILARCPTPYQKIFYPWDMEFLNIGPFASDQISKIYQNEEFVKVCRSKSHQELLLNNFGVDYRIFDSFEKIYDIIEQEREYLVDYLKINQFVKTQ